MADNLLNKMSFMSGNTSNISTTQQTQTQQTTQKTATPPSLQTQNAEPGVNQAILSDKISFNKDLRLNLNKMFLKKLILKIKIL